MKAVPEVLLFQRGKLIDTVTVQERPLVVGGSAQCDLVLPTASPPRALLWLEDGQLWIRNLCTPTRLKVNGAPLMAPAVLEEEGSVWLGPDIELKLSGDLAGRRFPYRMRVAQQGSLGMEILIDDLTSTRQCAVRSQNRTALLYLLAQQLHKDTEADLPEESRGWCSDESIACGVWGRHWQERLETHLYVLLHRIRKKVGEAGLDPSCIEKKRRHVRAWVQEVVLE